MRRKPAEEADEKEVGVADSSDESRFPRAKSAGHPPSGTSPSSPPSSEKQSNCSSSTASGVDFCCRQAPIFPQGAEVDYFVECSRRPYHCSQLAGKERELGRRNQQSGRVLASPPSVYCTGSCKGRRRSISRSSESDTCVEEDGTEVCNDQPPQVCATVTKSVSPTRSFASRVAPDGGSQSHAPLLRMRDVSTNTVRIISLGSGGISNQFVCSCCNHVIEISLLDGGPNALQMNGRQGKGQLRWGSPPCSLVNASSSTAGETFTADWDSRHFTRYQSAAESGPLSLLRRKFDEGFSQNAGSSRAASLVRGEFHPPQMFNRDASDDGLLWNRGGRSSDGVPVAPSSSNSLFPSLPTFSPTSFVRAYVGEGSLPWEATLDNVPAVTVSCCVAVLSFVGVQFLRHHVIDTRDHFCLFVTGTYMIFASYFVAYYFLGNYTESFRRISRDKQFYTIANLIKAGILASLVPFATLHLSRIILFDEWDTNTLRNLGCIYTIPDFVSMLIVKRMSWSTWTHHLCVLLFNFFSTMNDYTQENVCRCVVVYAAFSTFAYCVNVLLASRFLGVKPAAARVLSCVSVVAYLFFCGLNWVWQTYYVNRLLQGGHGHWTVYAYILLVGLVMYDDVTLCKWLLHNARNAAFTAAHRREQ